MRLTPLRAINSSFSVSIVSGLPASTQNSRGEYSPKRESSPSSLSADTDVGVPPPK